MTARRPLAGPLLAFALAACGPAGHEPVTACTADADCGGGGGGGGAIYCFDGACRASSAPVASIAAPVAPSTARLLDFAGSAHDIDPGDQVSAWRWTVAPIADGCEAEPESTAEAHLQVVFWCAGTYQVTLVATDAHGVESAPVHQTVTVAASTGMPVVTASTGAAVGHHCAGTPLACALDTPIPLSASGSSPLGGPVTYQWKALPPAADRAAAAVVITPQGVGALASATIATDGTAIAGSWRFRVRAMDADGLLGQAIAVTEVTNRPPVATPASLSLDHRYADGVYRAFGPIALEVSDPDGDPVSGDLVLDEPAGSGCTVSLAGSGTAAAQVDLTCDAPGALVAPRTVRLHLADVNGAATDAQATLVVGNRLPELHPTSMQTIRLDHTTGPCPAFPGLCFIATGDAPFVASDPDGDPLSPIQVQVTTGNLQPHSGGEAVAGTGALTFRVWSPVANPEEFRAADDSTGFTLSASVSDPFSTATWGPLQVAIGNRPPVQTWGPTAWSARHTYDAAAGAYRASAVVATFEDPDGDPIVDAGSTGDAVCGTFTASAGVLTAICSKAYQVAQGGVPPLASLVGIHTVQARVRDAWEVVAAPGPTELAVTNQPPTASSTSGAIDACTCVCPKFDSGGNCIGKATWQTFAGGAHQVVVSPGEPDGDPLRVTYTQVQNGSPIAPFTALPSSTSAIFTTSAWPVTYSVKLDDGLASVTTTATVTGLVCAEAGTACTY